MDGIFLILALWLLACLILGQIGPIILELLGYLLAFVARCIGVALVLIVRCAALGLIWTVRKMARGISLAFLFLKFLAQECWPDPDTQDECGDERSSQGGQEHTYEAALDLFGLQSGFTRKAFERAYRSGMKRAHPDVGGSDDAAQGLNAARETIMRKHGWA